MDNGNKQINNTGGSYIVTVRLWSSSSSTVETTVSVSKPTDFSILSTVLPITASVFVLIVVVVYFIYCYTPEKQNIVINGIKSRDNTN